MRVRVPARGVPVLAVVVILWTAALVAQQPATPKKAITHDVYDSWRSIQGTSLSRDGEWLMYSLVAQEGDGELVVRNLKTNVETRRPRGKDAVFSSNAKFVVYAVAPTQADLDKAKKDKKKPEEMPKPGMGVLDLTTGRSTTVERVKSFKLPDESAKAVAFLLEAPEKKGDAKDEKDANQKAGEEKSPGKKKDKKKDTGTDLVIRDLSSGSEARIGDVTEYAWSRDGDLLAYAVSSKKPENDGAFLRTMADGTVVTLLAGQGNYKRIAFDDTGGQLAFVSDRDDYKSDAPVYRLYYWSTGARQASELGGPSTPGMPSAWSVSEHGRPEFSKDGKRLFFGTAPAPKPEPEDARDPVKVDLWNWKDAELQPMQKARADEEKKRTYRAVVSIKERKLVQLATPEVPEIRLNEDRTAALGESDVPYRRLVSWDGEYADFYSVGIGDGSRRKIIEKAHFGASLSPLGGYAVYFDYRDAQWYAVRTADGKVTKLTDKSLNVRFDDETSNTPEPARPWGVAGWTDDDKSVLVYDRYDIWELSPDGAAPRMVTNGLGRKRHLVFRYQRTDADAAAATPGAGRPSRASGSERPIPRDKPLFLFTTDDITKATGYYKATMPAAAEPVAMGRPRAKGQPARPARPTPAAQGSDAPSDPVQLVMMDKLLGGFLRAKNGEAVVITEQKFEESPNLWVTDLSFASPRKVSDANPQQAQYIWGRSELVDFVNADGVPLRAILTKPEDFDPAKKYPLMVYIYEELTSGLHRFVAPAPGTSINVSRFVSNGYVVLQPDIVYDHTGYPGQAALKCVLPAVQRIVSMGFIDPKRIGIQGHSWGGYQITYLITQTDMFRAVEAGASVTNMVSAYGGIRWGTGMSRAFQYEKTQSRIGAPPWERPLQFIENSPIFWVEKVNTPYLTIHNDEDDAVPWYQGIEFFSALRRLNKEAYLFVYNGEKHGLRERDNQKHWTVHLCEFFDHYLKGAPRPEWMDKGVPYLERGTRDVSGLFKKADER